MPVCRRPLVRLAKRRNPDQSRTNGAAGAEYLYTGKGTWAQKSELASSDDAAGDYFGLSAGLSARGSTLIVGAEGHDSYTGSAYLFTR